MELLEHNRLYAMEKREVDEMIEHKVSLIFFRQIFDAKFMPLLLFIFFPNAWDPSLSMTSTSCAK
jgi:hypothetical protein